MNCRLKQDYTNRDRQNILNMTKICKEFLEEHLVIKEDPEKPTAAMLRAAEKLLNNSIHFLQDWQKTVNRPNPDGSFFFMMMKTIGINGGTPVFVRIFPNNIKEIDIMDREQRKKILKAGAKAFKRRSSCEYSNFDEFR